MLLLLAQIAFITGCAFALCSYVGWGAVRFALPTALRPFAALLVPLLGYVVLIWCGYMAVSIALNVRWSLVLVLVLATALNVLAWLRTGRPQLLAAVRAQMWPLVLFVITLVVGILPLLHYGYLTIIGQGWDTESYLPMAQHLNDYSLARIPDAPISPLRDLVRDPPRIGVSLGYTVLQGMTMLMSGQTALATFAPLLALLRAMGVLAVFIWLRATMGLSRGAALLGAALTAAGALLLWISYFNFAMQLAAWPLLALGLTVGLAAIEQLAGWSFTSAQPFAWNNIAVAFLAALTLAALAVAYYPALTLWVPLAAGLGLARVLEALFQRKSKPGPVALLASAVAVALLTFLVGSLTIRDYFAGFSFRYSLPAQHIGPDRFIAISEIIGLRAFRLANDGAQPPILLIWLAGAMTIGLVLIGLLLPSVRANPPANAVARTVELQPVSEARLRWLLVLLSAIAYLTWLRFGRPYEYGFMKGSAYASFVVWGLVAFGVQALWRRFQRPLRAALVVLVALPLLTALWAQALTIGDHWAGPAIFTRDIAAFDQATALLAPGATVAITSNEALTGPKSGLLSSMLYGHAIWGHLSTAYSGLNYWPSGHMPQYAVLSAHERAWPLDQGGRELWRSGELALYQLNEQTQVLSGRADWYGTAPPANKTVPASLDIWRRGGPNRSIEPDAPLTLQIGDNLDFGATPAIGVTLAKTVSLNLASLVDQSVEVSVNTNRTPFAIQAGVSQIVLVVDTPSALTITPEQPLVLISATAAPASSNPAATARLDQNQIAWSAAAEQQDDGIRVQVQFRNPGQHALRVGLTVVENSFDSARIFAQVLAAAPMNDTWKLTINPASGANEARIGDTPTPMLNVRVLPSPPDGAYFGVLEIYDGQEVVAHAPVFTVNIAGGKPVEFVAVPFTLEATPVGLPTSALPSDRSLRLGSVARTLDHQVATLDQVVLARSTAWPGAPSDAPFAAGDQLTTQLYWHTNRADLLPAMVSVQLIGDDNHKWAQWDGPVGGEWRPLQNWQAGDYIRQDVPLQIDLITPPGTYHLLLVVYDPANGLPLSFDGENALSLGDLVVR